MWVSFSRNHLEIIFPVQFLRQRCLNLGVDKSFFVSMFIGFELNLEHHSLINIFILTIMLDATWHVAINPKPKYECETGSFKNVIFKCTMFNKDRNMVQSIAFKI
jgi:hypothetical protein